jgi:hypothetical protein
MISSHFEARLEIFFQSHTSPFYTVKRIVIMIYYFYSIMLACAQVNLDYEEQALIHPDR